MTCNEEGLSLSFSVGTDMAEGLRNYQAISDMEEHQVLWKKFHICHAENTNGAHRAIVRWLTAIGQTEVKTAEECDYLLVFCPVGSRVVTDIEEALSKLPLPRPVILVVMHHTFDRQRVVAENWRQVDNPNVRLTVDCLFYEDRLLNCSLNDIMWANIQRFFGVYEVFTWRNCAVKKRVVLVGIAVLIFGAVTVLAFLLLKFWSAQGNNTHPHK